MPFSTEMPTPFEHGRASAATTDMRQRVCVPYFLDAQPLVAGLEEQANVQLVRGAPSEMLQRLHWDQADVCLLPTIELQHSEEALVAVPAGCIAAAGATLNFRVFSRRRPEKLRVLWADSEARTSIVLAQLLWAQNYRTNLEIIPFNAGAQLLPQDAEAILLVGDKLSAAPPSGWEWQFDLSAMWFELTGLPFVYAIWATREEADYKGLYQILLDARKRGQRQLDAIARRLGPEAGWSEEQAVKYLTRQIQYEFTDDHYEGIEEFFDRAEEFGLIQDYHPMRFYQP
jgi:chorismate dehydratase